MPNLLSHWQPTLQMSPFQQEYSPSLWEYSRLLEALVVCGLAAVGAVGNTVVAGLSFLSTAAIIATEKPSHV